MKGYEIVEVFTDGAVTGGLIDRPGMSVMLAWLKTGERHPYYLCFIKGCERRNKHIRRDHLEGQFVAILDSLTPAPKLFTLARAMFKDAWPHCLSPKRVSLALHPRWQRGGAWRGGGLRHRIA